MTHTMMDEFSQALAAQCQTSGPDEPKRTRLKFTSVNLDKTPNGHCSAQVELEWVEGERVKGSAEGHASVMGDLRVVADATLRAIEHFSVRAGASVAIDLLGVKTMRAFDANIVMVSVTAHTDEGPRRLLGCHLTEGDLMRGTVIATLQATNRVLGNAIATR